MERGNKLNGLSILAPLRPAHKWLGMVPIPAQPFFPAAAAAAAVVVVAAFACMHVKLSPIRGLPCRP